MLCYDGGVARVSGEESIPVESIDGRFFNPDYESKAGKPSGDRSTAYDSEQRTADSGQWTAQQNNTALRALTGECGLRSYVSVKCVGVFGAA